MDSSNSVHPTVIIEGDVKFGRNNQILPYTVLIGPLEIGSDNLIGPHVVIGSPGEDSRNPRHDATFQPIKIGDRNIIREFTAVQKPCYGGVTTIGNDVFLMHGVHVPHDAVLEDHVTITPMAIVGGIVTVMEGANVGMGSSIRQRGIVGAYSVIATNAAVVKDIKPFSRFIPGKPISVNAYAIKKYGFEAATKEIEEFVLKSATPKDSKVLAIVKRYEMLHAASGNEEYS